MRPAHPTTMLLGGLLLSSLFLSPRSHAATYYIAPNGQDSASGTTAQAPWKTFAKAIPLLQAGDTLMLLNGTYDASTTGFPRISGKNGTASKPITIMA